MQFFPLFRSRPQPMPEQRNGAEANDLAPMNEPIPPTPDNAPSAGPATQGLSALLQLMDANHERRGYEDALVNADTLHMQQNIDALRQELARSIRKTKLFYEDFIREINFHIASRSRMGMVDTAEELMVKKETAETHLQQVLQMEQELAAGTGASQGVFLSYQRGFQNGLAAISMHSFLRKNF